MTTSRPHLYQGLTREEFQLCWALRMTLAFEDFDDAYPLDAYATPGTEGSAETYDEQMKRAIRFLAIEHGFPFRGLRAHEDGRIEVGVPPVQPENIVYARGIALGNFPHPIQAAKTAIRMIEEHGLPLSIDPLHQLIRELNRAIELAPDPDPEEHAEYENLKSKALAAIGLERKPEVTH